MGSTQPLHPPGLTSELESPAASIPAKREGSTPPLAAKPERAAEVDSTSQPISNKRLRVTNPLLRPRHGLMPQTLPRSPTVLYSPSTSASGAARPFTGDALTATSPTVSSSAAPPSSSILSGGEQLQERSHPGLLLPSPVEHLPSFSLPGPLADLLPQAGPALRLPLTPMSSTLPPPSSTSFESQKRWRGLPCASPIPPSYEGQDGRSILPLVFPTKRQAHRWARIYIGGEAPELAERLSLSPSGTGAAKAPAVEAGQSDEETSEGSTAPGADTKRTSAGVWLTRGKNGGRPGDLELRCTQYRLTKCHWTLKVTRISAHAAHDWTSPASAKASSASTSLPILSKPPSGPLFPSGDGASDSQHDEYDVNYCWLLTMSVTEHSPICPRDPLYTERVSAFDTYLKQQSSIGRVPSTKKQMIAWLNEFAKSWNPHLSRKESDQGAVDESTMKVPPVTSTQQQAGVDRRSVATCRSASGQARPHHLGKSFPETVQSNETSQGEPLPLTLPTETICTSPSQSTYVSALVPKACAPNPRTFVLWLSSEPKKTLCEKLEPYLPGVSDWMHEWASKLPLITSKNGRDSTTGVLDLFGLVHVIDGLISHYHVRMASSKPAEIGRATPCPSPSGLIVHVCMSDDTASTSDSEEAVKYPNGILLMWPLSRDTEAKTPQALLDKCGSEQGSALCFYSEILLDYPSLHACRAMHHLLVPLPLLGVEKPGIEARTHCLDVQTSTPASLAATISGAPMMPEENMSVLSFAATHIGHPALASQGPREESSSQPSSTATPTLELASTVKMSAHLHTLKHCHLEELLARCHTLTSLAAPAPRGEDPRWDSQCLRIWKPNVHTLQLLLEGLPNLARRAGLGLRENRE